MWTKTTASITPAVKLRKSTVFLSAHSSLEKTRYMPIITAIALSELETRVYNS
jgi:hypothetical protein